MGTVEATSVNLTPPGGDPLVITSLYISPSVSYQHIHTDVEALFSLGGASIICGDFNAHHTSWGCRRNDNRGNIIKNLIDSTDTQIVAPNHTYTLWPQLRIHHRLCSDEKYPLAQPSGIDRRVKFRSQPINHFFRHKQTFRLSEANRDYRLGGLSSS
ncbi:hypothetical protein TNCV_3501771 [Trichonephila clavipes]|uniref:Endonuclease/exonuclease/phosphatase domain-containing protein n=1 Tax=Trichonephila clavipes TaxID=2585209 RepID=A0A8X6S0G8_TRICX|nr:hypothetical protein TNCV_3501771 [Trichonephila clavipes]